MIHDDARVACRAVVASAAEAAVRVENVEVLAVIGRPREIVGAEGHPQWRCRADLIERANVREDLTLGGFLAALGDERIHDRIEVVVVACATPGCQYGIANRGQRNARNEVLVFRQLQGLVGPRLTPVPGRIDQYLDALGASECGISDVQRAARKRTFDKAGVVRGAESRVFHFRDQRDRGLL